ncbi:MAG: flagellar hook protein FlgE [Firmicutes bacterium]|nr:flagellar hook protein FlgE [Bacillota bacterium]
MMRSMYAAVSGLRNHQTRMDVIGNNIANVNTIGYKKSRVTFKDAFSQVLKGASRPQGGLGGTNPMQVGLGMVIGSIDTIHSKGNTQSTGRITDLAIDGEGFFILNSGSGSTYYTRAGAFGFDREGNLTNPAGLKVQGWYLNEKGERVRGPGGSTDPAAPPSDLSLVADLRQSPPKATGNVSFAGNLDAGTAERLGKRLLEIEDLSVDQDEKDKLQEEALEKASFSRSFDVYDKKGNDYNVQMKFQPIIDPTNPLTPTNQWKWIILQTDENGVSQDLEGTLVFTKGGKLSTVTAPTNNTGNTGSWKDISVSGSEVTLTFIAPDGEETTQVFDFSAITQYADPRGESVMKVQQDGYTYGDLEEIVVDDKGVVSGSYSNGTSRPLLQVAIATFTNPAGLIGIGNSLYSLSNNSGDPQVNPPGMGMAGPVAPSSLEMSNVDLSEEFTDMIVTQRGFQANSRVITASDEMLQELVNIKR